MINGSSDFTDLTNDNYLFKPNFATILNIVDYNLLRNNSEMYLYF